MEKLSVIFVLNIKTQPLILLVAVRSADLEIGGSIKKKEQKVNIQPLTVSGLIPTKSENRQRSFCCFWPTLPPTCYVTHR